MKKTKKIIDEGINGLGVGVVNTNSVDFKELQRIITEKSKNQSKKSQIENKLLSIRFQMESYLNSENKSVVEVGWYLKEFLKELSIKNKYFAEYIGFQESNLSALFTGKRKINTDLALKLGKIFRVEPTLWMHIQSKNEIIRLESENKKDYQQYNIDDLIKKAS